MKAAARTALVPALVLCAALTAAPYGASAGEEPLVLFPGAAVEDETANTAEGPAVAETATAPAAIGMPAGKGTPQIRVRETEADTPAGGSRLLRALAEASKAPAPPDDGATGDAPVHATEGCPRALLRRLLVGATGEADALSALGIEREILTLCRERQEVLVGLFEAEAALRELSMPSSAAAPEAAVKPVVEASPPAPISQSAPAVRPAAPSPLRAALEAAEKADEAKPQAPRYAWFSIIGTAGALRAGITDGSGVWFVSEGDALPGGARIAAIAGRPPAVRVTGSRETLVLETLGPEKGEATALPYRARPGDAP